MKEIKLRYVFKRKEDGHIFILQEGIENLETRSGQLFSMLENELWKLVSRDLFTGLSDKNEKNVCIYEGDIVSLQGKLIGNKYETPKILKDSTNLLIEGFGTETWTQTEKEGLARGLHYSE